MQYSTPSSYISLARLPTPLQPLDRLSSRTGGPRIWLKRDDLSGTTLTGNKVRKLEFVVRRALDQQADTLITCGGLQSNHCRATALVAAQLGLSCHLILRGEEPTVLDGNTLISQLAGAEISYIPATEFNRNLTWSRLELEKLYESQGRKTYFIPTGASDGVGVWGYYRAANELVNDFAQHGIKPSMVCCATGSGGTHAGLALGFSHLDPSIPVRAYAVCDDRAYFQHKSTADIREWYRLFHPDEAVALPVMDINDEYVGAGYAIANEKVFDAIKLLARTEGVILDPVYTGKAFAGMLDQIRKGEFSGASDIVFVHTGGVFGLFPYRAELF